MKNHSMLLFLFLISLNLIFITCKSSTPLPAAYEQNSNEKEISGQKFHRTLYPTRTDFYRTEVETGAGEYLYFGKRKNITSWILFRFGFRGLPEPDSSKIKSVSLTLFPSAVIGDSTSQFIATGHLMGDMNLNWDELNMNWTKFQHDYDPRPLTDEVTIAPALTDSFYFKLDISQFLNPDSTLDSMIVARGFCLRFDETQNPEFLLRLFSCDAGLTDYAPTLTITSSLNGVVETTYDYYAHDLFIVRSEPLPADSAETHLYLGRGISHRSLIQYDLSDIQENATINRAQLKVTLDVENSIWGLNPDLNVLAYPILSWPENAADVAIDSLGSGYESVLEDDTLRIEVRNQIQDWTSKQEIGEGFLLQLDAEGSDISRLLLYGANADSLVRPRLILDYTLPPSFLD